MLKEYIKYLWNKFIHAKLFTKIFVSFLVLLEIFIMVICFVKSDVDVTTPGYLNEVTDTISIKTENNSGHVLTVSVQSFTKASLIQSWIASREDKFLCEPTSTVITEDEYDQYAICLKKIAINDAIMVAYREAKKVDSSINLVYDFQGMVIYYVSNKASDLRINDIVTKIDGNVVTEDNAKQLIDQLLGEDRLGNEKNLGDIITFTILRYDDSTKRYNEIERSVEIIESSNHTLMLGLSWSRSYELNGTTSTPSFSVDYNERYDSRGSSGGAMMTLSIYNQLLETDVTHGLFVAGTGTITYDDLGSIGAIGAIEQKTIKVCMSGIDVFFVDDIKDETTGLSDYDIAVATAKEYGYDTSFIKPVKNFTDIINTLKELGD